MELAATKPDQHALRGVLWMLGAVLSFALMAVVLLVRPNGLFTRAAAAVERV